MGGSHLHEKGDEEDKKKNKQGGHRRKGAEVGRVVKERCGQPKGRSVGRWRSKCNECCPGYGDDMKKEGVNTTYSKKSTPFTAEKHVERLGNKKRS